MQRAPPVDAEDVALSSGIAIAPALAAQCILDTKRTVAFLRGVKSALEEARRRFPNATVEVVYAGTGPFAPLAIPLLAAEDAEDVNITLLDVHEPSIQSVRMLLEGLSLSASVVRTDAATYTHNGPIHLVVTETMQRSLANEPHVAIVRNLRPQLAPRGLLVPERVSVDVALVDPTTEQARWAGEAVEPQHDRLATVIEVRTSGERSEPVTVSFPRDGQWVTLLTDIDVFGVEKLRHDDSGLTTPEILWPFSPSRQGDVVRFHYEVSSRPGIRASYGIR